MPGVTREVLAKRMNLRPQDLVPLSDVERAVIGEAFRERLGMPENGDESELSEVTRTFQGIDKGKIEGRDLGSRIEFSETNFPNVVVLEKWVFSGIVWFEGVTFSEDAHFKSAAFGVDGLRNHAFFGSVTFSDRVTFEKATFGGRASFGACTFSGRAIFRDARFREPATFRSSCFQGFASFESADFAEEAHFGSVVFAEYAGFSAVGFRGIANFESAKFFGVAAFEGAVFNGFGWFEAAHFEGDVDFSNANFGSKTDFSSVTFGGGVPEFYERKFHQDTDFTTEPENWPEISRALSEGEARESKRAYTRLRQVMSELHKPDDEHFFGRQEMRCKALLEGRFHRAVSWAFGVVSDYGHSVGRPVLGLFYVILLPWAVLPWVCVMSEVCPAAGSPMAGWKELALSVSNTFSFFGFHRLYFNVEELRNREGWMLVLGAVQTVCGFGLLFFLGLGLRNRFRLK